MVREVQRPEKANNKGDYTLLVRILEKGEAMWITQWKKREIHAELAPTGHFPHPDGSSTPIQDIDVDGCVERYQLTHWHNSLRSQEKRSY